MKRFILLLFFLFLIPINAANKVKELYINACGVVRVAFVRNLANEFEKRFKIKVYLNSKGGDRRVIKALNDKKAQLGFGCRELLNLPDEKGLKAQKVAWGILAFMVNKKNRVNNITLQEAKDILRGKIKNWKELGGDDAPIHLYLRKPGAISGVGYSFRKILFKNLNVKLKKTPYIVPNSDYIRAAVYKDPYAFAVGDAASVQNFSKIKLLRVNGVLPTKKELFNKKYQAQRAYYIYIPKKLSIEAEKFIDFTLSKEGQKVIKNSFAASLNERERLFELLNESAEFENFSNDNELTLSKIIKKHKEDNLTIYACGITRVAFAKELFDEFLKRYKIKIKTNKRGGDPYLLEKLYNKEADIALLCRAPFKEGKERNLWSVQVAWGALSFIVNSKNRINNLSTAQLKSIILGKIKNWKELGGDDAPIHLILRKPGALSGVGSSLRELLFNDKKFKLNSAYKLVKNSGAVREEVQKDPFAFAVDDITSSKRTKGIKILNIDGIAPSKRAVLAGDYKFRRPFYACLRDKPNSLAKIFIDYILSSEGQKIISNAGAANLADANDLDSLNNFVLQRLKLYMKERE